MAPEQTRALAEKIAAALFAANGGRVADRLVLTDIHGRHMGGWALEPMTRFIESVMREGEFVSEPMKWFMSYLQRWKYGRVAAGSVVYSGDEHPLAKAKRWNDTHGVQEEFSIVVLSFAQVPADAPEMDTRTDIIEG